MWFLIELNTKVPYSGNGGQVNASQHGYINREYVSKVFWT